MSNGSETDKQPERRSACVYCDATDRKITREHLWPQALHKRLQIARSQSDDHFWIQRLDKTLATEPALRDVCETCNNGPLSALDTYGCSLWDQYFHQVRQHGDRLVFRYDYDRLLRWLLKLCYNSARIHRYDAFVYPPLRAYILTGESPHAQQQLFVQLVPPGHIPPEDIPDDKLPTGVTRTYLPQNHRIGFMQFSIPDGQKLLRAIHFRSFSFFIAFFRPDATPYELLDFATEFAVPHSHITHLRSDSTEAELVCDGPDAWHSAKAARAVGFQRPSTGT